MKIPTAEERRHSTAQNYLLCLNCCCNQPKMTYTSSSFSTPGQELKPAFRGSFKPFGALFPVVCLMLLAACGGGGGGGGGNGSGDGSAPEQQDVPAERNVVTKPGAAAVPCFETASGDCLSSNELNEAVKTLTDELKRSIISRQGDANWVRGAVNAYEAYAHLAISKGEAAAASPGQGVTIGFIDSGIHTDHPDFTQTTSGKRILTGAGDDDHLSSAHGTAVVSAAAGWTSGIAWGANVRMISGQAADTNGTADTIPLTTELVQRALDYDLDILNLSLAPADERYWSVREDWTGNSVRNDLGQGRIDAFAQRNRADKTILVWSSGNSNCDHDHPHPECRPGVDKEFNAHSPTLYAGAMAFIPELRGHSLAVVATRRDGHIASFSNACGIAAEWCIAAPGEQVRVAVYDPATPNRESYTGVTGTSFAAPFVSGGLAVMKQLFRGQLSSADLVGRLLATADRTDYSSQGGPNYADRNAYGQGFMDLGAATHPWGIPAFMGTQEVTSGDGAPVTASVMTAGPAMGDSLNQALDEQEIAAFDSLGAPFWYEAGDFTVPSEGATVATRLNRFLAVPRQHTSTATWRLDLHEDAPATTTGHLGLTHGASQLSLAAPRGLSAAAFLRSLDRDAPLGGLTLSWTPAPLPSLTIGAGYLHEQKSLLGSQGRGAFGSLSGETLFLSARLTAATPQGWQLAAEGELGMVDPSVAGSQFISGISSLSTSAFSLKASRPLPNGSTLRIGLAQPLRVESGAMTLSLPTGRTQGGVVTGKTLPAPLEPTGRQLDLSAEVEFPWRGGSLSLGATRSRQPQHRRRRVPEWTFFTGWRTTW